jgi:hypothetical protein
MAAARIFEVISDKFNVVGVCISANYAQKWVTKFINYNSCLTIQMKYLKKKIIFFSDLEFLNLYRF